MGAWQSWMIWPDNAIASALVLFLIALPFLYGARVPIHTVIRSTSRLIANPLRIASRWLFVSAQELRQRNQVVLLAHGREEVGKSIEREFERISKVVQRDLNGYPGAAAQAHGRDHPHRRRLPEMRRGTDTATGMDQGGGRHRQD